MSQKKNFERVKFEIQLIDPMKEVVADRGGGWGSMLHGLSRCCGDRSERWATKLLVGKIQSSNRPYALAKNSNRTIFVKSSTFKILLKYRW